MPKHVIVIRPKLSKIKAVVGNIEKRIIQTFAYPVHTGKFYDIPTYEITVSGTDETGAHKSKKWEIIRFGVYNNDGTDPRHSSRGLFVAGRADAQSYIVKRYFPTYSVHSTDSDEKGAWDLTDGFLIHDGPDDPLTDPLYASIGCIEICGGPRGFDGFNDFIIKLSGSAKTGNVALREIAETGIFEVEYLPASRPPLQEH